MLDFGIARGTSVLAVTVIVCTYRRYDRLGDCLRSLLAQSLDPRRREILVIENSYDGADEMPKAEAEFCWPDGIRRITTAPAGLSRARQPWGCASTGPRDRLHR